MTQGDRLLPAIEPSFAKLDDRGIEELLAFAMDYGHLLKYYDLENIEKGHWEGLFYGSQLGLLIRIINSDWLKPENEKTHWCKRIETIQDECRKCSNLFAYMEWLFKLSLQLNAWLQDAIRLKMEGLSQELQSIIKFMAKPSVQKLMALDLACQEKNGFNQRATIPHHLFSDFWELKQVTAAPVFRTKKKYTRSERVNILLPALNNIQVRLKQSLLALLRYARKRVSYYWEGNAKVSPDLALLYTFLRLFQSSQDFLNSITKRHLDFYYYQILGEQKKAAVPDRVFVNFEISEETEQAFSLPKKTALMAGVFKDGQDILYETLDKVQLNRISIASLKTIFVKRSKIGDIDFVQNIFVSPVANSQDGQGKAFEEPHQAWPTFGSDQSNFRHPLYGRVGWAITDPILHFSEGKRFLDLAFFFKDDRFNVLFESICTTLKKKSKLQTFQQLFYQAFQIQITGPDSWIELAYALEPIPTTITKDYEIIKGFKIIISIDEGLPAIVGKDLQEEFESGYDSPYPILKIVLNPKATWYAYSLLAKMELEKIVIKAAVEELKTHQLFNETGPLESEFPFYPFGEQAMQGANLLIGNAELFQKKLDRLSVAINWLNLPKDKEGFDAYYKAYELGINNNSFQAAWSALSDGKWSPQSENDNQFPLFNAPEPGEHQNKQPLSTITLFKDINLNLLNISPTPQLKAPLEYGKDTKTGFLRMQFTAPTEGFGGEIYTKKFAEVVTKNAELVGTKTDNFSVSFPAQDLKEKLQELKEKLNAGLEEGGFINSPPPTMSNGENITGNLGFSDSKLDRRKQKPIPNPPYLPYVKDLSINYEASTTLFFSTTPEQRDYVPTNATIYQLFPFGQSISYEEGVVLSDYLVPSFPNNGNLFIGLQNVQAPEELSILFALESKATKSTNELQKIPIIQWKYLSNRGWESLDASSLIFDRTNGFIDSGIIRIKIPGNISLQTSELPAGQAWLSAQAAQHTHLLSETIAVLPQAVEAKWKLEEKKVEEHLAKNLPAGSITALQTEVPQISGVVQTFPSFGGILPENDPFFYARVSERLQHKNRGILHKDYEYLILENFPSIFQVKVISPLYFPECLKPGQLKITVISTRTADFEGKRPPQVSFHQLKIIDDFIQTHTTPFVDVTIANPLFERVKVIADIVFEETDEAGSLLKKLNRAIVNFISPWLRDTNLRLDFEQIINIAEVKYFIKSRPYVKQVYNFSMVQIIQIDKEYELIDNINEENKVELTELKSSTPSALLISVKKHELAVFSKTPPISDFRKKAIGTMIINRDFITAESKKYE